MKKSSPNSSRGSASCSLSSRISKRLRDKASASSNISDRNAKNEISKYFIKETDKDESEDKKRQPNFESPYKNIVSEPRAYLNNSLDDEDDFKNPQQFKLFTEVLKAGKNVKKPKSTSTKQKRTKKKTYVKGQVKLTKMIEERLGCSDANPEHLQMALALSKSEQSTEESDGDNISPYASTQEKQLSLRETLEQFGFKSDKEMERKKPAPKRKKKSKYQFVKPILDLRTEEDRQNLISSKINMILSENALPEYSYEREKPIIRSKYLSEIFDDTLKLSNLDRIRYENLTIDQYYIKHLNIEVDTVRCGQRLKDWHKIPGREETPPREVGKLAFRDIASKESNAKSRENITNLMMISDNLDGNVEYRSISPDLFTSEDEEIDELKKSIDEKLYKSVEMLNNTSKLNQITSINEDGNQSRLNDTDKEPMEKAKFDKDEINTDTNDEHENLTKISEKLKNNLDDTINETKSIDDTGMEPKQQVQNQLVDDMDKTEDILATLEITLTETINKITTPRNKNLNAFSASLLSNFDSLNKRSSQNEGIKDSDDSICELTFTSMRGIEHFESFSDRNQDKSDENVKRSDEICDLTLSEGEERILDGVNDKMFNKDEDFNETNWKDDKVSGSGDDISDKYEQSDMIYDLTQSDQDFDEKIDKNSFISSDDNLNRRSTDLMDYNYDIDEAIYNKSNVDNINEHAVDKLLDKNEQMKSKYEILSDSDESDNFENKIISTDPDITALLKNTILNVSDNRSKTDFNNFKKSLSFTPISNLNSPNFFKKHATFSTPSPQKHDFDKFKTTTISTSSESEVICISDEELNYSSIHSTPFNKIYNKEPSLLSDKERRDENINTGNEDVESYSYLEKYYDHQFIQTEYNDLHANHMENTYSPITHPRILELSKGNTPFKGTPISLNENGFTNPSTPVNDDVIIKTRDITPMPDYDNMNTPTIGKELEKIGVKQLKRHRGVQILKHVYETTHPICSNEESKHEDDSDENINVKRPKLMEFKSRRKLEIDAPDSNYTNNGLSINSNRSPGIEIVGDILESDNLIFERKQSKKVSSCAVPLDIAWYNLVASNTELKQNILLYEPLQLEILYLMLKEQGFNYNIQDLLTFLDKKCVTIQTGHNNKQPRKRF